MYKLVPISALSTLFVTTWAHHASAKSLTDYIFEPKGVLLEKSSYDINTWMNIGRYIYKSIKWIINLPSNLPHYSVDLLSGIYKLLSDICLQTPIFIFDNPIIQHQTLVLSGISILLVAIVSSFMGLKQIIGKRHTPLKDTALRFSIATVLTGLTPFLFKYTFTGINALVKSINNLTSLQLDHFKILNASHMGFLDTTLLFGFDAVAIYLLIPILLQSGKRWFDLMCSCAVAPLALSSYVFNETSHYFNAWLDGIIEKGRTQLIYAFFIFLMSVFMFATSGVTSGTGLVIKLLIILGGLFRMANPPTMVTKFTDNSQGIHEYGRDITNTFRNVRDFVTMNRLAMFRSIKNKFVKN